MMIFIDENLFENGVSKMSAILFRPQLSTLPLVLHIYASVNQVSLGSDNGLSPIRRQAII